MHVHEHKLGSQEIRLDTGTSWYLMSCAVTIFLIVGVRVPTYHKKSEPDL